MSLGLMSPVDLRNRSLRHNHVAVSALGVCPHNCKCWALCVIIQGRVTNVQNVCGSPKGNNM